MDIIKRRQHFVPKTYLKLFSSVGRSSDMIWAYFIDRIAAPTRRRRRNYSAIWHGITRISRKQWAKSKLKSLRSSTIAVVGTLAWLKRQYSSMHSSLECTWQLKRCWKENNKRAVLYGAAQCYFIGYFEYRVSVISKIGIISL